MAPENAKSPMIMNWKNEYCKNDHTPKAFYRLCDISIKTPMTFSTDTLKMKFENSYGTTEDSGQPKAILNKKSNA